MLAEDRVPEGARVLAEDRVPEGDEEWEERWVAVDQSHVPQGTVFARNAVLKALISPAFPAPSRYARNVEQK